MLPKRLYIVGLGPGDVSLLSPRARSALEASDVIVGYHTYLSQIREVVGGKETAASGMQQEVARAKLAVELTRSGKTVAVVCGGDPGIYGMASLVFEVLREQGWARSAGDIEVEVVPGVPALSAAAALLGAPLSHDFAVISLSDLLTPWEAIALRLELAARADMAIVLYNPKSSRRREQLGIAQEIILRHRAPETPVGIVRNAHREGQNIVVTDLQHLGEHQVDMTTTIVVGNSATFSFEGLMVTPRGYSGKYDLGDGIRTEPRMDIDAH
ncbi:MAG: precorrin-3B C(17)-methyltransferase [Chloroflexi bacterium]|nr:precorrin-3B C(17)-methyltransferase [Chloroflexota bacterium]